MKRNILNYTVLLSLVFSTFTSFGQNNFEETRVKNVILMIGDGMGIPQIYHAMTAVADNLNIERSTNTAIVVTRSANDDVTDSAAAGTAIATGTKTNNGSIGVDANGKPLKSILKIAEENGLSTGVVATSDITHATPASFIANVANRGQASEIAAQFISSGVDVFIGGGYDTFAKRKDGKNLVDSLKAHNYQVITSPEEVASAKGVKVAGLLYPEHAPKMIDGRGDMLSTSTAKAIEILSQNDKGFFLMVEGSQIDWGGHDNNIDYIHTELLDFDKAVGVAIDYAEKNPKTLVIVVADHETGGLTLVEHSVTKGKMEPDFSTTHHSATPVGLYAYGKGADSFKGFIDNTDIFRLMLNAYQFKTHTK